MTAAVAPPAASSKIIPHISREVGDWPLSRTGRDSLRWAERAPGLKGRPG
jgi:hypothetical protein